MVVAQVNPNVTGSTSLRYSTYLGGSSDEEGTGIAVTSSNVAVVVGFSTSNNFPLLNPYQNTRQGDKEGVLARINPALSGTASLLASTYLGGNDAERDLSVVIDASGAAVISGYTRSANFPTAAPLQTTLGGGTCGGSTPYPCGDAFVTRFDLASNAPVFSTFLGGNNDDEGHGVAVDGSGAIYLTGFTFSTTFPTANPKQGSLNGTATDAFVAKITPTVVTPPTAYDERYAYDTIGNLTSKAGVTYSYAPAHPHAVSTVGSQAVTYDANGNTLADGTRSYVWDAENRPSSMTYQNTQGATATETYRYDADGERVQKRVDAINAWTTYLEGVWEETDTGAVKTYYAFGGQTVAVRDSTGVTYLHGDHLGSISVATTSTGAVASRQQFDP